MRNTRTISVALVAASLIAASIATTIVRAPVDDGPARTWKITQLRNGERSSTVVVRDGLPVELEELFEDRHLGDESQSYLVEVNAKPGRSGLPPAERKMVEFLLLLPVATLLVCIFRNVVGLTSFGTFAPALLGLSFRELQSPFGAGIALGTLFAGWMLRRGLNRLHLLQVPRTALLLSFVVAMLLIFMSVGRWLGWSGPHAVALFPMVILTGMIERLWSMEEEEHAAASLRTLLATLFIAGCVWLLAIIPVVPRWMLRHPETLGLIMACQLLLGRYTGFRLLEIHRFRAIDRQEHSGDWSEGFIAENIAKHSRKQTRRKAMERG